MATPEGRVKRQVRKVLDEFDDCYVFMPVQTGFGKRTLDYLICFRGLFVAIETKAPGREPTHLQRLIGDEIVAAGGTTFVISDQHGLDELRSWLQEVNQRLPSTSRGASSKS